MLTALGDAQLPLLAAMLLGGCAAKLRRTLRDRSMSSAFGPTALFPLRLRRPAAIALCLTEMGLGIGLILTAGRLGGGPAAEFIRLATALLFVVATCALIELRSQRPDVGCGCFGEFSSAPVTGRTLARSGLLALAALGSARVPPMTLPHLRADAPEILLFLAAELAAFCAISPEVREVLVRIGYSAPCELRVLTQEQTLAVLQRSTQFRRHSRLITQQRPSDMWREMCWRYVTYPGKFAGRETELVFALYLGHYRPTVISAMVDVASGAVVPWGAGSAHPAGLRWRLASSPWRLRPRRLTASAAPGEAGRPARSSRWPLRLY